ncbi:glycosyl transferase, group 1 family protein [Flavobacterium cauense R2A-7]|uniref:Glycosyl transferase family 4 n=1 Tax=Flavobacterium cauense R2A-7 TaxID=1341154 RepID=V6RWG4_9FLAO|nr:glycosyltransferase family 4 protein [Flavobacterium cauense]ESU18509.1 glycosyl transferase, group 1 family protein [Flavobacterium cauense R2A-7]KGO80599.1 glycosyl transferase family 1 [Flavobacterium cauense R2A-7]TWI11743.1 glycosyl transferase family 4 [Flavobacterium cauense R2A-7]
MKKVLIITYYWPPAGGPGVQRWLKFVKYLPEFGIEPIVYIPENPTYPLVDEKLLQEVPEQVTILKNKIIEPYSWASLFSKKSTKKISSGIIPNQKKQSFVQKMMLWVRGNLFIPDARVLWVKPSVNYLSKYIQENGIETIITTGPPHSLHLIGLELKQQLGIKWIADFRDPWTTIGYHKALKLTETSAKKHKNLESKVMNTADFLLVTSPTTKTEFERITTKPIHVITNGYDVEKIEKQSLDEKFTLAHIGSFLSERNPRILWKALRELVKENPDFKKHFELKLIGATSQEVLDTISEFKLSDYVNNLGYVSHQEAIEHQRKSQVLLLIEIDSEDTKSIIPGKLFEYMVSERPILAIGPKDADFATILKQTNTGVFALYDEKDKVKETLLAYFNLYVEKNLKVHPVGLQQYSRKNLTKDLAALLQ